MKRSRNQTGFIVTLTPASPEKESRTLHLSGPVLTLLKIGLGVTILLVGLGIMSFISGGYFNADLADRIGSLEATLAQKERQLDESRALLGEMDFATEKLLRELGRVGALVRDLQAFAGIESDLELALAGPGLMDSAATLAVGGPGRGVLPTSAVDLLGGDISRLMDTAEANLSVLAASIGEVRETVAWRTASIPQLWPVRGWISSAFGLRASPISGERSMHRGVDIVAPYRTPVAAAAAGQVTTAGWSGSGYGYHVVLEHGNGFRTLYGHLSEILVEEGDTVYLGDSVGLLGNTGYSTGPHLHFEIWEGGAPVDPISILPEED